MFDITLKIASASDAEKAANVFAAIARELGGSPEVPEAAAQPRTRVRRVAAPATPAEIETVIAENTAAVAETLLAGYNALAEASGAPVVEAAPTLALVETTPVKDRETLLNELRALAREHGALWLRPILAEHKAAKLSELSDEAITAILAANLPGELVA